VKFFVKQLRNERGLSIYGLAKRAGVAKGTVEQVDAGTVDPRLETMGKLAKALEVPIWDLFCAENCENGRCEREETAKLERHMYCTDMSRPHCASSVCPGCGHRSP